MSLRSVEFSRTQVAHIRDDDSYHWLTIGRVESVSGKHVVLLSDAKFGGHATIKIASDDQPAHALRCKPEQEAVLPYLVAFQ